VGNQQIYFDEGSCPIDNNINWAKLVRAVSFDEAVLLQSPRKLGRKIGFHY